MENCCCSGFRIHSRGSFDQPPCWNNSQLCISARRRAVGYFVTDFDLGYSGSDCFNYSGSFNTDDPRKWWTGVYALTTVDVGEIHADGLNFNDCFAKTLKICDTLKGKPENTFIFVAVLNKYFYY